MSGNKRSASATDEAPRRSSRISGKPAPAAAAAATRAPAAKKAKTESEPKAKAAPKEKPGAAKAKAGSQLSEGSAVPSVSVTLSSGDKVDASTLRKSVIFSYPKANTSGCTVQAKAFRDMHDEFASAGYTVYGLSNDSPTTLASWKTKLALPYELISDSKRELIGPLTGSNDKTRRSHFVIDDHGKLGLVALSVKPAESAPDALKFVQK